MTTSWAHLLNGNVESAIQSNVAGVLLCMLALFSIPMLAYFAIIGRSSHNAWFSQVALIWCVTAAAIAIIEWAIRLAL